VSIPTQADPHGVKPQGALQLVQDGLDLFALQAVLAIQDSKHAKCEAVAVPRRLCPRLSRQRHFFPSLADRKTI
jgi:hypothetical protein